MSLLKILTFTIISSVVLYSNWFGGPYLPIADTQTAIFLTVAIIYGTPIAAIGWLCWFIVKLVKS